MKVIIAGSRSLTDWAVIRKFVDDVMKQVGPGVEFISGGAPGVDSMSAYLLKKAGREVRVFKPDWEGLGKRAGFARNTQMAQAGDVLFALWDGASKGTDHMIEEMRRLGKKRFVRKVAPTVPAAKHQQVRTGPRPVPPGIGDWPLLKKLFCQCKEPHLSAGNCTCLKCKKTMEHPTKHIIVTSKANLTFTCWCGYCTKLEVMGNASCIWCQQKIDLLSQYERDIEWLRHRACINTRELVVAEVDPADMGWPEEPINEAMMSAMGWL